MKKAVSRAVMGVSFLLVGFGLAAEPRGVYEITSGLGRKLYSLPDDAALIAARKAFAADPKSADLAIRLSKAQAGRRQYK